MFISLQHYSTLIYEKNWTAETNDHLTPARMAIIKKSTNSKYWRGCGEKEPFYTVSENVNSYNHYEVSLKKLSIKLPYDPAISLWEYSQRKP